jgi:hypothetical protein
LAIKISRRFALDFSIKDLEEKVADIATMDSKKAAYFHKSFLHTLSDHVQFALEGILILGGPATDE